MRGHFASEVNPRSAIGTSIVVLVFWIAAISASYGRPARKPSIDPLEVRDQPLDPVRQPHVVETLGVQSLLLSRQVGEVLSGDRRPARIVWCHRLWWCRFARREVAGHAGQRPDLEQSLLWAERTDPVGGGAAVGGQDEMVREGEADRVGNPTADQVVEVGHRTPPGPMPLHHCVVERAAPTRHRLRRIRRQRHRLHAFGDADVVLVGHAAHAVAQRPHEVEAAGDDGVHRFRRAAVLRRRQQLRVRLRDVVALHERGRRQLPVHRQPAGLPPLDAQRLDLPGVVDRGEGLHPVAQRRGIVVEVDPGATAPQLTPDRDELQVVGGHVVLAEGIGSQHEGVAPVDTPAPAVEGADECPPGPMKKPLPSTSFTPRCRHALW